MRLHPAYVVTCLIVLAVLSLVGCTTSTEKLPAAGDELRATVEAEHVTTPHADIQRVRVVLTDANGADIERADLRVEVNGVPMRFEVGQGNYYDRHPFHTLGGDDGFTLTPNRDYHFVVVFPDSTRREIGTVHTPAELSPAQVAFAPARPAAGPVSVEWRDLAEPVALRVGRMVERKQSGNSFVVEGSGPHDPDALRRTVGPGGGGTASGRWVLPETLVVVPTGSRLLSLQGEAVVTRTGMAGSGVSPKSTLTATRRIELALDYGGAR